MVTNTFNCLACGKQIPAAYSKCPWCGAKVSASLGYKGRQSFIKTVLLPAITIIILSFILILIFMTRYKEEPVTVNYGTVKYCVLNNLFYDRSVYQIMVPPKERDRYKVVVVKACPPEIVAEVEKLTLRRMKKYADPEAVTRDQRTNEFVRNHSQWEGMNAWLAARGRIAIGMTKDQVELVLGSPIKKSLYSKEGDTYERWYYGDSLYGIVSTDHYAEFKGGRLVDFEITSSDKKEVDEIRRQRYNDF